MTHVRSPCPRSIPSEAGCPPVCAWLTPPVFSVKAWFTYSFNTHNDKIRFETRALTGVLHTDLLLFRYVACIRRTQKDLTDAAGFRFTHSFNTHNNKNQFETRALTFLDSNGVLHTDLLLFRYLA